MLLTLRIFHLFPQVRMLSSLEIDPTSISVEKTALARLYGAPASRTRCLSPLGPFPYDFELIKNPQNYIYSEQMRGAVALLSVVPFIVCGVPGPDASLLPSHINELRGSLSDRFLSEVNALWESFASLGTPVLALLREGIVRPVGECTLPTKRQCELAAASWREDQRHLVWPCS